jgi:enolase-phosphatase E1
MCRRAIRESNLSVELLTHPARTVLLDIEGTTTPLDFVRGVLFPYACSHARAFLQQHRSSPDVRADALALTQESMSDSSSGFSRPPTSVDSEDFDVEYVAAYVEWLSARDRKSTPLKTLQGNIWEEGYRSGRLRSPVFDDVPRAFGRWQEQNKAVSIFSSGSVLAQELLFAHTMSGDLTRFISGYFDTNTGAKADSWSYQAIAQILRRVPPEIVFISDVNSELDAAASAGLQTLLCMRPGNPTGTGTAHNLIHTFDEVFP